MQTVTHIWPRVIYNVANEGFLREDNSSVLEALEDDPDLWGFSMRFRKLPPINCIPTNKVCWLKLNEYNWPSSKSVTKSTGKEVAAILESIENCEAHQYAANHALRAHPERDPGQNSRKINNDTQVVTYTRAGFVIHDLSYRNKTYESQDFVTGEQQYTPEVHRKIQESREPHFGASCLTMLPGEMPASNHARLTRQHQVRKTMEQHMGYLNALIGSHAKFAIHPDWAFPE